jgi:hypothetical protein
MGIVKAAFFNVSMSSMGFIRIGLEPVLIFVSIKTKLSIDVPSREKFKQRIRLISGGACNRKAFPDGEVTVYPWDLSIDDWVLSQGRKGSNLFELVPQVADLNGAAVDDLFIGDATTILLVSRSLRHNSVLEFSPTCPHCNRVNKPEKLKIPDNLRKVSERPIDWKGTDTITLPDCEDVVVIRPLRVRDEKALEERGAEEVKAVPTLTAHILATVVSINDSTPDNLRELLGWFKAMSANDQDFLNQSIDSCHPRLDNDVEFQCDFCNEKFVHTLDLSKPFFRRVGLQRSS